MAVEKQPGLKIEKEIPCQLTDSGRIHQSGGVKRTLVAIDDIEYVFNGIFGAYAIFTFRDHAYFIKSLFKDFTEMKNVGIFQRNVIMQTQSADKVSGLHQRGFRMLILMVHGLGQSIQTMFMIGNQKRRQQRKGSMFRFYSAFSLTLKTDHREMVITNMMDKDFFAMIISNPLGAIAAAA